MATFLELCQAVADESGTMTGGADSISTTEGQTGRAGKIVRWTSRAWRDIQIMRPSWMWMQTEFEAPLTAFQGSYTGADLSLTRVEKFLANDSNRRTSAYDTAVGVSDEGFLKTVTYADFQPVYRVGPSREQTGKPRVVSIGDDGSLNIWPRPDGDYTVHGWYKRTPQTLQLDADVPEMPEAYHWAVVWKALLLLGQYDEATPQYPFWNAEFRQIMKSLERDQLPTIEIPGALA